MASTGNYAPEPALAKRRALRKPGGRRQPPKRGGNPKTGPIRMILWFRCPLTCLRCINLTIPHLIGSLRGMIGRLPHLIGSSRGMICRLRCLICRFPQSDWAFPGPGAAPQSINEGRNSYPGKTKSYPGGANSYPGRKKSYAEAGQSDGVTGKSNGAAGQSNGVRGKSAGKGGAADGARLEAGSPLLSADGVKAEPDGIGLWPFPGFPCRCRPGSRSYGVSSSLGRRRRLLFLFRSRQEFIPGRRTWT
jgi:hypothetical protein